VTSSEPTVIAESPTRDRPRLFYADNLRVLLTALVVLHHAAITYGNLPLWYYTEPAGDGSGQLLDLLVLVNQAFFMGCFFMISGFFVPGSRDRKGGKGFMRGRLVRLGVPLLLFVLLMRPVLTLPVFIEQYAGKLPYPLFYIVSWDPGPMWFVEVLLVFCLGYLLVRRWTGRREASHDLPEVSVVSSRGGQSLSSLPVIGFVVVLSLVTFAWRLALPLGSYVPVLGLPSVAFLPQYLGMFIVGALAHRKGWFQRLPRWTTWAGLPVAMISLPVYVVTIIAGAPSWSVTALLAATSESLFAVGITLVLLGLFQRRFNRQSALAGYLSRNAFRVYFLHPLVLVGVGYALSGWQAIAILKFAAMAVLALPLCWLAAGALRRLPGARRVF
jgi:glucan biosynthesis protein C